MIHQNRAIAQEIQGKAQHYKMPMFVTALNIQEWMEYLVFLLSKDKQVVFSYTEAITFPYKERAGETPFYTTLVYIQDFLFPEHKRLIEGAVNALCIKHHKEDDFLSVLLKAIKVFTQGKFHLIDISFETIVDILQKNTFKDTDKKEVIPYIGQLQGSNAPSKDGMQKLLLYLRDLYKEDEDVVHAIAIVMTKWDLNPHEIR